MTNNRNHILYIDIETCSLKPDFFSLSSREQEFWEKKCRYHLNNISKSEDAVSMLASLYRAKSGIYAEFAKVVCVSVGFTIKKGVQSSFVSKSFCHPNEELVLMAFSHFLAEHIEFRSLCGHNIREFDVPFLARRFSVHGIGIPDLLNVRGKRPWEVKHLIDTMELWKFGDYKHFTSLGLLASLFHLEDPKSNFSGEDVHDTYWIRKDMDKIRRYCENDVRTVYELLQRMCPVEVEEYNDTQHALYAEKINI